MNWQAPSWTLRKYFILGALVFSLVAIFANPQSRAEFVDRVGGAMAAGMISFPNTPDRAVGPCQRGGDIPCRYQTAYRKGAKKCPGLHWTTLAGIGKIESNHGRSRLPGVRSGWNFAGAAGPMQFGIGVGRAGNSWAKYGHGSVYQIENAAPAAARYLCAHGAPRNLDQAIFGYNHLRSYVASVKRQARIYKSIYR